MSKFTLLYELALKFHILCEPVQTINFSWNQMDPLLVFFINVKSKNLFWNALANSRLNVLRILNTVQVLRQIIWPYIHEEKNQLTNCSTLSSCRLLTPVLVFCYLIVIATSLSKKQGPYWGSKLCCTYSEKERGGWDLILRWCACCSSWASSCSRVWTALCSSLYLASALNCLLNCSEMNLPLSSMRCFSCVHQKI